MHCLQVGDQVSLLLSTCHGMVFVDNPCISTVKWREYKMFPWFYSCSCFSPISHSLLSSAHFLELLQLQVYSFNPLSLNHMLRYHLDLCTCWVSHQNWKCPNTGFRGFSFESNFKFWSVFSCLIPRPHPAFCCLLYGRAWYLFSCEHDVIGKWQKFQNKKAGLCILFDQLNFHHLVCITVAPHWLDTCGKLPCTLALLAILSPSVPTFN